jgi:Hemerythrin HHE cation binding domain
MDHDAVAGGDVPSLEAVRRQRVGVRTALDDLERALAAPATGRAKDWAAAVAKRGAALGDAFAHHVDVTEQQGGLFDDIVAHAPRLAPRITRLRNEHVEIAALLSDLGRAARPEDAEEEVDAVRDAALAAMGAVVRHRSAGSSLLYEAYFVDIDASD